MHQRVPPFTGPVVLSEPPSFIRKVVADLGIAHIECIHGAKGANASRLRCPNKGQQVLSSKVEDATMLPALLQW